jgi:aldehyde dehydrogenase (NAD+)
MSYCPVSKEAAADDSGVLTASLVRPFRAFSHFKSTLDKEVTPDPDVKYSPPAEQKLKLLKSIVEVE